MNVTAILGTVAGLLVLAFVANRLFRLTRIPDLVILMGLGLLLGPVLGWVNAARVENATNLLGTLAIILVLFEGGLELDLRRTIHHFPGSFLLATLAYIFSVTSVAAIVSVRLGLPYSSGVLVGAVLGCTSSTVVLPVLQQVLASEPVKVTLMLEASWGDVLAVLTVGALLGLEAHGSSVVGGFVRGLVSQVGVALLFAVPVGVLWSRLLPVLSEQRFWHVLTFSVVLLLYAGTQALGASGLIAVLGMGLTLANFPGIDPRVRTTRLGVPGAESQQAMLTFHSELGFLVRTFFFILIGAVARLDTFRDHPLLIAGTLGVLFVSRWLAVLSSRWSWRGIQDGDKELILMVLPRGLITVVLALEVANARGAAFAFLPGLAFATIVVTNLMLVFGSMRHARRTQLAEDAVPLSITNAPEPPVVPPPDNVGIPRWRWVVDLGLLLSLALGGVFIWFSSHPEVRRPGGFVNWIRLHTDKDGSRRSL